MSFCACVWTDAWSSVSKGNSPTTNLVVSGVTFSVPPCVLLNERWLALSSGEIFNFVVQKNFEKGFWLIGAASWLLEVCACSRANKFYVLLMAVLKTLLQLAPLRLSNKLFNSTGNYSVETDTFLTWNEKNNSNRLNIVSWRYFYTSLHS